MEVSSGLGLCRHGMRALETLRQLELRVYYSIKDRDLAKLKRCLDAGMTGNHTFSESVPEDGQNINILQLIIQENFNEALKVILFEYSGGITRINLEMAFLLAIRNNFMDMIHVFLKALIKDKIEMELADTFRFAMYKRQYSLVAELIENSEFDVNMLVTWGLEQPLHVAINHKETYLAQLLLERGALVDAEDRRGVTPLIRACSVGTVSCVRLMLAHGAELNHKAHEKWYPDYTALHAVLNCLKDADKMDTIIQLLIRAGLVINKESWLMGFHNKVHPNTLAWLRFLRTSPKSLLLLSSMCIRRLMLKQTQGTSILQCVKRLPLPPPLIRCLCIED